MKRIHSLLFATAIVAALGFGSASAFAQPSTAQSRAICGFYPEEFLCISCCGSRVHEYNAETGECRCR